MLGILLLGSKDAFRHSRSILLQQALGPGELGNLEEQIPEEGFQALDHEQAAGLAHGLAFYRREAPECSREPSSKYLTILPKLLQLEPLQKACFTI